MVASALPCMGPKRGRKCYVTPPFSGIPNAKRGKKFRSGYLTPAFSGNVTPAFSGVPNAKRWEKFRSGYLTPTFSSGKKRAEVLRNPCILRGPQRQAREENQNWLLHPYLLRGPEEGGSATYPLHS